MNERTRERKFLARIQSSHELILAAKASNGGGHCSCSTDTTPDRGSGWPRLRGALGAQGECPATAPLLDLRRRSENVTSRVAPGAAADARLVAPWPPPSRTAPGTRSCFPSPVQKDVARDACRLSIPCLSSSRSLDLGHVLQLPREVSA